MHASRDATAMLSAAHEGARDGRRVALDSTKSARKIFFVLLR
jgi:hypothetical protein